MYSCEDSFVVAAFNQEKALVGAFPVIKNLRMELFEALARTPAQCYQCRRAGCVGRRPADVPHGAAGEVRGRGEGGQPHLEPAQAAGGAAAVLHPPPQGEG